MILFGHLGLTYAATRTFEKTLGNDKLSKIRIDYRLMFLGSILPDVIDKTIIFFMSNETFKSGRLFGHTLLFSLILFAIGLMRWKKKKSIGIFVLVAGCLIHQILDSMWNYLDIYFWPVYGFPLSKGSISLSNWIHYSINVFNKDNPEISLLSIIDRLMSSPVIGISEIIGLIIILYFVINLVKFRQTQIFLKTGQVHQRKA